MTGHIIETRDLTRTFVKRGWNGRTKSVTTAVDHLDLTITPGESVGYIGANGAGKSTTIKMLMGILVPTSGTVRTVGLDPWPGDATWPAASASSSGSGRSCGGTCPPGGRWRSSPRCTACPTRSGRSGRTG